MRSLRFSLPVLVLSAASLASASVTSPEKQFGYAIGADYVLPNYVQLSDYWRKLDRESDRLKVVSIGKTEEGRDQLMAIVSSPANMRKVEKYRGIAQRLAQGDLPEAEARKLAAEGKAIVWIDGGLHANEVLGAQQLLEMVYRMVSADDAETKRILDNCIILFVHANPDGMDLVSNWYMRESDPKKRSADNLPRLYQKYIGHDNNRDFYAANQKETENMNRVMYREWFPQIVYNHHQTGPRGAILFCPPFRPPFNHNCDPLVLAATDLVGIAMHNRFLVENKPGAVTRAGASYSAWWNGGLRTTAYFHNIVGILTETIGGPTPTRVPFVPERQVMSGDLLMPVAPQEWHFRQSIDYSVTANLAILNLAAQKREEFLFGVYRMAQNSVERGRMDHWTNYPSRVDAAVAAGGGAAAIEKRLQDSGLRDARAYVIPSDQSDFPTAVKFVNSLIKNGVTVHRAPAPVQIAGKTYPAGSLVVKCDQAYRPHILDMFEPQDHPNDIPAPGAPPIPPYDVAGYTLAFQMGVKFDRVLTAVDAKLDKVEGFAKPDMGTVAMGKGAYVLSPKQNDSFTAAQRLLQAGVTVVRATQASEGIEAGDFVIASTPQAETILKQAATELGIAVRRAESAQAVAQRPVRVGLWDRYGGSMPSGWIRWLLEKQGIPFRLVFAPEMDGGDLKSKFDVIVLPDGSIPALRANANPNAGSAAMPDSIPAEYRSQWGSVTATKTIPQLRKFLEDGGTIVAIGSGTNLGYHLGLPIENALADDAGKALPSSKYYIPGSVLRARVDNTQPIAWGMPEQADFAFDESPVFRFKSGAEAAGLKKIAWFDTDKPLRSGWAWGQSYLKDGVAALEAPVGKGKLYLFGPEITFRAQPHGTFRMLFNGIFESAQGS